MKELAKQSLIQLAKEHRASCVERDGNCGISLMSVRFIAEDGGIKFTEEELKYFV